MNQSSDSQWPQGSAAKEAPSPSVPRPDFTPSWQQAPQAGNTRAQFSPPPSETWQAPGPQPPAPSTATKSKKRSGLAALVAVAVLAGGLGGAGGAAVTTALSGQTPASTSTQQTASTAPDSSGTTTTVIQGDPTNPDWAAVAKATSAAVVAIQVAGQDGSSSQGSGVVIDAAGHVVTNNHVVSSTTGATITALLGNVSYEAEVVGTDPSTDLAVIKLVNPPATLTVMAFGNNTALKVGEPVMAIGNPLGLSDTVTTGIVSALNRPVTTRAVSNQNASSQSDSLVVTAAIQTNAAINPGNSGGALVNTAGELVGITSSIATIPSSSASSSSSGNIGIGFAIGADQVRYIADQLIASGTAEHPQIGISAQDVTGAGQLGARVTTVNSASPAEQGGVTQGDLITAVNGIAIDSVEQLVAVVRAGQVGKEMTLTVVRNGSEESLTVTPVAAAA